MNNCFMARKKTSNLGSMPKTSGPIGYGAKMLMKIVGHIGDAAHPKHQPAIIEARGRRDQEKGMVAVLEITAFSQAHAIFFKKEG
jgi:hypothetical protein